MLRLPVALGHVEGLGSSLCQDSKLCLPKDSLRQGKLSFLISSRFGCGPATCISADPIQVYAVGSSTELCLNDLGSNLLKAPSARHVGCNQVQALPPAPMRCEMPAAAWRHIPQNATCHVQVMSREKFASSRLKLCSESHEEGSI